MRAAGLEFSEQGDVWRHLASRRHQPNAPATEPTADRRRAAPAHRRRRHAGSPLAATPQWPQAHEQAGADLGFLDRHGALTRDLREVLTHHLLFLFNRLGISAADAWLLATAAVHVTFHHPSDHPIRLSTRRQDRQ